MRHPESEMMSFGYDPMLSEGSIKPPIFQTSTFVFKTAEEGKRFFEVAYGLREKDPAESMGLIYSRLNNPNLEILEDRLTLWENAEAGAVFESGMAAISTTLLELLPPGSVLIHSAPLYGGTDHFIHHVLPKYNIDSLSIIPGETPENVQKRLESKGWQDRVAAVYIETPANPTTELICIKNAKAIAQTFETEEAKVPLIVDNTYMGPVFSKPTHFGADIVLYSATKYIGGHSDVVAGAAVGNAELITRVKTLRTFLGNMGSPFNSWLLLRSLETLSVRMERQAQTAEVVADWLKAHPMVEHVHYLKYAAERSEREGRIHAEQYTSNGAMMAFLIKGGEKEAFQFLNGLKLVKLAVSLGSTESLAEHPATMTHADVSAEDKAAHGVTDNLVRISIGLEHPEDLIADMTKAFENVG
ncbi:cystathionine gamma-synthase family protein [Phaeocystidibacter luteus]|uniref:Cystathionine gamma-synthase family protein n=1 Tax=Phaeocystidibacter luteus TaxID=911197 RepID=A0A6N6RKR6_9FLAO|nr:cystathionine gamma-synthase family protein [Phaeocystidibacter luteus]KAB2808663.1 cystathionine gamma-synthase family protein [Phaeocystidibacter luteus]